MARPLFRPRLTIVIFVLAVIAVTNLAQVPSPGQIQGVIQSNRIPLPGVVVVALNTQTLTTVTTSTDVNGQYLLRVPGAGKYVVSAEMPAFAASNKDAEVSDVTRPVRLDFELSLLSRTQRSAVPPRPPNVPAAPAAEATDPLETAQPEGVLAPQGLGLPGMSADAPTESVAISGNTASPAFGGMFDENRLMLLGLAADFGGERGFGAFGPPPGAGQGGTPGEGGGRGGPGGDFGGRGGPRGGPGGGGFQLGGQRGRRNVNRPNVNFAYTLGSSALDAAPYSLKGAAGVKPQYAQNRLNATIGGPLVIPRIVNSPRTNYNLSYNGSLVRNPFDAFSTVPTLAERNGDFSARGLPLTVPPSAVNPVAKGLLAYIPEPNLPGAVQNFHYVTTNQNNGNDLNVRVNHNFGAAPQRGQRGGGGARGGGAGGGRGGRGARGTSVSFGLQYRSQNSTSNNAFPTVGGTNQTRGLNLPISFSKSFGRFSTNTNFSYNRNRTSANNLFSNKRDVAGLLGISGVSKDPLDWGLPTLTFTNYSALNDMRPSLRLNQTLSLGENLGWFRGRHNVRIGGNFRLNRLDSHTGTNARGTFTFNGAATGYDFADFLRGLPQLTSVQYGSNTYRFRSNSYDVFVQDDWRILGKLTLNLGLRYEFSSPLSEAGDRLVNLDASPDFSAVALVLPGATGLFSGLFPEGLINPDRNNWAPQIGIAWRAATRTIMRAGYGVSYNSGVYNSMVQQFAFQPPFSVTQTNIASAQLPLTLQNGFPEPPVSTVTNNFGVDKNYRVGYAQTWNLSVQRELPRGLTMSVDYTGTKGTRLDILQAPNRTAAGLRIAGVQPFTWESSTGNSIAHVGRLQVRRRLQYGISAGGNYTWSKAIDNASSFGAAAGNVAQDASNLAAERALSSFDQPHRFNGDFLWQLPFGLNRRWLTGSGIFNRVLGEWQLNGTWNFASSTPFTARVIGDTADIRRGTNGTLRANATGLAVAVDDPGVGRWFNTAAFSIPAAGAYGNAARNTIRGPATHQFDMALSKNFAIGDRAIDLRAQATNVFNVPQYRSIDTTVNSPSFGRVTSVGSMRKIQIILRYRF